MVWSLQARIRNGVLFQFTGEPLAKGEAACRFEDLTKFIQRSWYVTEPSTVKTTLPVAQVIRRAMSIAGEQGYNVLYKNCEHAARRAATGQAQCDQYWFGYKDMEATQSSLDSTFEELIANPLPTERRIRDQLQDTRLSGREMEL